MVRDYYERWQEQKRASMNDDYSDHFYINLWLRMPTATYGDGRAEAMVMVHGHVHDVVVHGRWSRHASHS